MSNAVFSELTKNADAATKEIKKTLDTVTDANSFVETDRFVSFDTELGEAVGEGMVTGFARIGDIRVGLFATNGKVLKGSIGRAGAQKAVKLVDASVKAQLPVVAILDTAGARFGEGIDAMEGYAAVFAALARAYGNVPTAVAVKGADYGLSAYFAAVSDICIVYAGAQLTTKSPLLLAAGTKSDPAKIGTGESLGKSCDVVTHTVKDDKGARDVLSAFLQLMTAPLIDGTDDPNRTAKAAALKTTDGIIKEIFDAGSVFPVRENYAPEVKTGWARLDGIAVGYAATCGKLTKEGAGKITELLNTCESFSLPVIHLVDCEGVETSAETDGAVMRAVSDMTFTYCNVCVPKLALIYGNAIGAGYTAFASKSNTDYTVAWHTAKIGVLADTAAAQLLYKEEIAKAKNKEQAEKKLAESYAEENMSAPVVAKRGYLDNVIEPALSRPYLISALQTFWNKE